MCEDFNFNEAQNDAFDVEHVRTGKRYVTSQTTAAYRSPRTLPTQGKVQEF